MTFAEKLKQLRSKTTESLQEVADAISVSKAHVWELETGRSHNPSLEILQKLAEHFKVTVAYFADNEGLQTAKAQSFFRRNAEKIEDMSDEEIAFLETLVEKLGGKKE